MKSLILSAESLQLAKEVAKKTGSFHQYHHILFDLGRLFTDWITYMEIGCYAGASSLLMLYRPETRVIAIDSGLHIKKEDVERRIKTHNPNPDSTQFQYVKGDSHSRETFGQVRKVLGTEQVQILFIDGGHSRVDVEADFGMYREFIAPGGFIVFDDYDDIRYCPEVRKVVDAMEKNGTFREAGFETWKAERNEYILQKVEDGTR